MAAKRSYCTVLALRVAPMSLQKAFTIEAVYPLLRRPYRGRRKWREGGRVRRRARRRGGGREGGREDETEALSRGQ